MGACTGNYFLKSQTVSGFHKGYSGLAKDGNLFHQSTKWYDFKHAQNCKLWDYVLMSYEPIFFTKGVPQNSFIGGSKRNRAKFNHEERNNVA